MRQLIPLRSLHLEGVGGQVKYAKVDFEAIATEKQSPVGSRGKKTRPCVGGDIYRAPRRRNISLQISYDFYFSSV